MFDKYESVRIIIVAGQRTQTLLFSLERRDMRGAAAGSASLARRATGVPANPRAQVPIAKLDVSPFVACVAAPSRTAAWTLAGPAQFALNMPRDALTDTNRTVS